MTDGKWYENTDFVDKFKIEFEKAGLPLEYKARKIFEERGFKTHSSHYKVPIYENRDAAYIFSPCQENRQKEQRTRTNCNELFLPEFVSLVIG